jgi:hypothetical protein
MANGGIRVTGLSKAVRELQGLGVDVDDLKEAFGSIAAEAARTAAGFAPSRSGRLRGSIRGNRAKNKATVTAGRARVPYAGVINFGWPARGIRGHEFFQRTDAVMAPRAVELLETELHKIIKTRGLGT